MKRHFNLLASVLLVIAMVFAFASCDVIGQYIPGINQPEPEHQHTFVDGSCECGEADPDYVAPHEHNFVEGKCECGETDPNYVAPHEHNFVEGKCECGETDPNYVAPHEHNFVEGKCECGETDPNYVAPHEHNFVEGKCECGETDPNYVPPHEHSYEAAVTAPTCTEAGYTTYTCACGDSYNADEVAALGHKHETTVVAPTCTDAGYTTYTCACGDSYNADEVKALGHTFVDSKCTKCDAEYVAPATGDWALVTELKTGDHVLIGNAANGKLLSANKVSATSYYNKGVDYSADNFANVTDAEIWVVTKNDDGTYSFVSLTGEKLGLAASYSSLNSAGPNFSWALEDKGNGIFYIKNTGRNLYIEWYASKDNWSCYGTVSGNLFDMSFYAKGEAEGEHVHNHISKVVAPTCTEAGYTAYTCKCGDTYSVAGEAATGHNHEATVVAPTCTEAGYTKHLCACGDSYNTDETAALGHSFAEGTCGTCGAADPDYVAPGPVVGGGSVDFNTIVTSNANGDSSYTKTFTTTSGWTVQYCAIQCGGPEGCSNPQYVVIGPNNTYKAICLVGKTSTPGSLTSPTLSNGLSKITIKYTKMFTDTSLSVTVTVTDSNGNTYTHVIEQLTMDKNDKQNIYTDEWVLETPIYGDFTISVVNNCPSNLDSNKDRMTILDLSWEGAAEVHEHSYENVVTLAPTCTAVGSATPTCSCGETLEPVELAKLGHIDENLDVKCDREGCNGSVWPVGDTKVSLFTANCMIVLSLSSNYYVEGTVTSVEDARNGKFVITDDAGDTILIYLPVDADGVTHANWVSKVVVGDVVSVYGKPVGTSGLNTDQKAAVKSGVLTFITKHPHVFGEPTCTKPGYCECGQDGPVALGHADNDGDKLCDACGWNVTHSIENVTTKYNDVKDTDKVDTTAGTALWEGTNFNVLLEKGAGTFNTSGTDHMRYYKNNVLTITSTNGLKMVGIGFVASSDSYTDELEAFLTAIGATSTKDGLKYIVYFEATESVSFTNSSAKNCRFSSIEVIYEAPAAKAEPVTVVMANTITDTQTSYMTGGNDAALVGLDPSIFTVTGDKGNMANNVVLYYKSTLNVPSQIRLSSSTGAGHSITVSAAEGYKISSIKITFTTTANHRGYVVTGADGTTLYSVATDATFDSVDAATAIVDVNGSSFTITNAFTVANKPVWIAAIEITYEEV